MGGNPLPAPDIEGVVAPSTNGPSDSDLWTQASAGDAEAFGVLFERHGRAIYNYCFRRTGDWALAEDLASAVFLEAWRRRRDVALHEDSLLAWLYGVATNQLRNVHRSLRRHHAALERLPAPPDTPDIADDVVGRLDDERRMRALLSSFRQLPAIDQDVLALCVWQELTYEQAATALGVPIGTVRSRLARARRRFREPRGGSGHEPDEDDEALARAALAGRGEEER
jgi:RNA polymerase sigma-70 factor (ECF subfamily)